MHLEFPLNLTETETILEVAEAIRQHDFYLALISVNRLGSQLINVSPDVYNKTMDLFAPILEAAKIYSRELEKHDCARKLNGQALTAQLKELKARSALTPADTKTFMQDFSDYLMNCLDDTYPCIVHHLMFSLMLLSMLVVKRTAITIVNDAKVKLEKYLNISNVIVNFILKRCLYYLDDTPAFTAHYRSHFHLNSNDLVKRRSDLEAKTGKKINMSDLQFEKWVVFARFVREFKDALTQTFPKIMAYRVNTSKTVCIISRDNIYQFLDLTNPNKINAQTNSFVLDVWPKIIKWFGFSADVDETTESGGKLKELYQALFFHPYLLCFSSDYVSVVCAHRAYLISQMCKSAHIKREKLCDSLLYLIKHIDTIDFVTCNDLIKTIRNDPEEQLNFVVMCMIDYIQKLRKMKNEMSTDEVNEKDDNIIDKLIGEFEHWFSREMTQTFSSMTTETCALEKNEDVQLDFGTTEKKKKKKKNK